MRKCTVKNCLGLEMKSKICNLRKKGLMQIEDIINPISILFAKLS